MNWTDYWPWLAAMPVTILLVLAAFSWVMILLVLAAFLLMRDQAE